MRQARRVALRAQVVCRRRRSCDWHVACRASRLIVFAWGLPSVVDRSDLEKNNGESGTNRPLVGLPTSGLPVVGLPTSGLVQLQASRQLAPSAGRPGARGGAPPDRRRSGRFHRRGTAPGSRPGTADVDGSARTSASRAQARQCRADVLDVRAVKLLRLAGLLDLPRVDRDHLRGRRRGSACRVPASGASNRTPSAKPERQCVGRRPGRERRPPSQRIASDLGQPALTGSHAGLERRSRCGHSRSEGCRLRGRRWRRAPRDHGETGRESDLRLGRAASIFVRRAPQARSTRVVSHRRAEGRASRARPSARRGPASARRPGQCPTMSRRRRSPG